MAYVVSSCHAHLCMATHRATAAMAAIEKENVEKLVPTRAGGTNGWRASNIARPTARRRGRGCRRRRCSLASPLRYQHIEHSAVMTTSADRRHRAASSSSSSPSTTHCDGAYVAWRVLRGAYICWLAFYRHAAMRGNAERPLTDALFVTCACGADMSITLRALLTVRM